MGPNMLISFIHVSNPAVSNLTKIFSISDKVFCFSTFLLSCHVVLENLVMILFVARAINVITNSQCMTDDSSVMSDVIITTVCARHATSGEVGACN